MENQNRLKTRISRMFRGSFGSCRTRDISDVIEKSVFMPQKMEYSLPSKNKPIPSMCKPRCPDPSMNMNSIISRKKILNPYPHFLPFNTGHSCPPFSPASPFILNQRTKSLKIESNSTLKRNFSMKHPSYTSKNKRRDYTAPLSSSSQSSAYYADKYYMCSSGDEEEDDNDESDAFFSSRSTTLTSDSSGSYYRSSRRKRSGSRKQKKRSSNIRRRASKMGVLPVIDDGGSVKVKDSFAVVKKSSDPYNDFRTSMLEMIVEKQIFSSNELEKLLQCFLSLNSCHHHRIIVEVFMEIWETLFSHWS